MNIITKKVRLIPAPFVGSSFRIRVSEDELSWGIDSFSFADGESSVRIDWGDGAIEVASSSQNVIHTYEHAGEYLVRVGDSIATLRLTGNAEFGTAHAHKLIRFETMAQKLYRLSWYAFKNCVNLEYVNVKRSCITTIDRFAFADCVSLVGRIDLPLVTHFSTSPGNTPFIGCRGGITEIHFCKEMAEVIGQSADFLKDSSLGTGTAVVSFDL